MESSMCAARERMDTDKLIERLIQEHIETLKMLAQY